MVTSDMLLDAWERGAALPPPDRALSLLSIVDEECPVEDLSVGESDALLFDLRHRWFGAQLDLVASCPSCDQDVEFELDLQSVCPASAPPPAILEMTLDGYRLEVRVPCNGDLSALARLDNAPTPADLLDRCLIRAYDPSGTPVPAGTLPIGVQEAALEQMADADVGSSVVLAVSCPCGEGWIDELDIRAVVWSDLEDWTVRLMQSIHRLARGYGWNERDIMALSPWRREWYERALGW